ncbi:MAG TPA: carboxypeptidase-like regulatory domain-containing protein, partial [Candidatus Eisenbacteria bacterium]|nr:carboxypeptidase-like regulatory domain-containing protein [Candidatus Eisenbacteria bacterium]
VQVTLAILTGVATLILGVYNINKTFFSKGPGELSARVLSDGAPVASARVELYDEENTLESAGETSGDGTYVRKGIESGRYIAKFSKRGFDPVAVTVRVPARKTAEIEVEMRALPGTPASAAGGSGIRGALEEVGASWIKQLGKPKAESEAKQN